MQHFNLLIAAIPFLHRFTGHHHVSYTTSGLALVVVLIGSVVLLRSKIGVIWPLTLLGMAAVLLALVTVE